MRVVDPRSRAVFERIARAMAEEQAEQIRDTLTSDPGERIRTGFRLAGQCRLDDASIRLLDDRALAQAEFYRRWRERTQGAT
jgi:hypothetical protein